MNLRFFGRGTLLVLAIACQRPSWDENESLDGSIVLDDTATSGAVHVSVRVESDALDEIEMLTAWIDFTCTTSTVTQIDGGKVGATILADSAAEPERFSWQSGPTGEGARLRVVLPCDDVACGDGFTLDFERHVEATFECTWEIIATASGDGEDPPPLDVILEVDG